jgi:hypothetical protein
MSLKSQQYAGDYDMIEEVRGNYKTEDTAVNAYMKQFQDISRGLLKLKNCFIGDIKAGSIEEWVVIPESAQIKSNKIVGYNASQSRAKAEELRSNKVLTEEEYKYVNKKLLDKPSVNEFLDMKKELRFHLVRWTPDEVLKGSIKLRDGRTYTLADAFKSPAIVKLDAIAYVENNRYTDFSIIFLLFNKGKAINAVNMGDEKQSIKNDLLYYLSKGNYFKASKRMFSLARKGGNKKEIECLNEMMNGDLGRLYSLTSDIGTLLYLLENEKNIPLEKVRYEIDQFRSRLGNIYAVDVGSNSQLKKLLSMEGLKSVKKLRDDLEELNAQFEGVLNRVAKRELESCGLLPLRTQFKA